MAKVRRHKTLKSSGQKRRAALKGWRQLGFLGKVWRVLWVTVLTLWLITLLQVFLGWFINPPLTPLMIQRFGQQLFSKDRKVCFERDYVPLDSISNNLVTAVVYAEDGLFMYHHGFDVKQMKQAYRENKSGRRFRGGSTISNQTAKNAFLPHSRNMVRKAFEAYYTVMIVPQRHRVRRRHLRSRSGGAALFRPLRQAPHKDRGRTARRHAAGTPQAQPRAPDSFL